MGRTSPPTGRIHIRRAYIRDHLVVAFNNICIVFCALFLRVICLSCPFKRAVLIAQKMPVTNIPHDCSTFLDQIQIPHSRDILRIACVNTIGRVEISVFVHLATIPQSDIIEWVEGILVPRRSRYVFLLILTKIHEAQSVVSSLIRCDPIPRRWYNSILVGLQAREND